MEDGGLAFRAQGVSLKWHHIPCSEPLADSSARSKEIGSLRETEKQVALLRVCGSR
jgi:hypothetical protein